MKTIIQSLTLTLLLAFLAGNLGCIKKDPCQRNTSFECAKELFGGQSMEKWVNEEQGESYHFFSMPNPGVASLTIHSIGTNPNFKIEVYDSTQSRLAINYLDGSASHFTFEKLLQPARYFVKVTPFSDYGLTYGLSLDWDFSDPHEYNNSFETASSIFPGEIVEGKIRTEGDTDFYQISLQGGSPTKIKVDPAPAEVRVVVQVFDKLQQEVCYHIAATAGVAVDEEFPLPGPGQYFFKLSDAGDDDQSRELYRLMIDE